MQLFATVLSDVCYRIYGDVRPGDAKRTAGANPRHHLQELFRRRLERGQCHHAPALGWREFTCSYWGAFRDQYEVDVDLNLTIPSMLVQLWTDPNAGKYAPRFSQNVAVEKGVLTFAE
jgi:CRISPR-associated protein Cas5d